MGSDLDGAPCMFCGAPRVIGIRTCDTRCVRGVDPRWRRPAADNDVTIPVIPGGPMLDNPRPPLPAFTPPARAVARRRGAWLIIGWLFLVLVCAFLVASCVVEDMRTPEPLHVQTPETYGPPAAFLFTVWNRRRWRWLRRRDREPAACDYCAQRAEHTFRAVTTRGIPGLRVQAQRLHRSCGYGRHISWASRASVEDMR